MIFNRMFIIGCVYIIIGFFYIRRRGCLFIYILDLIDF